MKVAITATRGSLDSEVDPRFGRAAFVLIVDGATGAVEVVDNQGSMDLAHGAGIAAVETLVRHGVSVLLTGQVGPKAEQGLRAARIEARTGVSGRCRDALSSFAPEIPAVIGAQPAAGA